MFKPMVTGFDEAAGSEEARGEEIGDSGSVSLEGTTVFSTPAALYESVPTFRRPDGFQPRPWALQVRQPKVVELEQAQLTG